MSIHYDWDYVERMYKSTYEATKTIENGAGKLYADHASGMLRLIPLIRNLPEFSKLSLDVSMDRLILNSSQPKIKMYLSCGKDNDDLVYRAEIYQVQSDFPKLMDLCLEEFVPALQQILQTK